MTRDNTTKGAKVTGRDQELPEPDDADSFDRLTRRFHDAHTVLNEARRKVWQDGSVGGMVAEMTATALPASYEIAALGDQLGARADASDKVDWVVTVVIAAAALQELHEVSPERAAKVADTAALLKTNPIISLEMLSAFFFAWSGLDYDPILREHRGYLESLGLEVDD